MLMSYYVTFVYRGQRKGSKRRKEREEEEGEEEEEEKSTRRLKMAWHTVVHTIVSRIQITESLIVVVPRLTRTRLLRFA